MPIASIQGLDHVVVVVRDLDRAEAAWRGLGFTVSPRGIHSAHMGTANHTLMLGEDYLELMGVLTPTERNAPMRELLTRTEGIDRVAFTTTDAAAGYQALLDRGLAGSIGPIGFSRPVRRADGTMTEARFETFQWPLTERPGGVRLFACQHFTRDAVWLPELTSHANAATRVRHVEVLSNDPSAAAAHLSRLIDEPVARQPDGGFEVRTGGRRGTFQFVDQALFAARHPGVPLETLPERGGAGLSLATANLDQTKRALGERGITIDARTVAVAPKNANGVLISFVAD